MGDVNDGNYVELANRTCKRPDDELHLRLYNPTLYGALQKTMQDCVNVGRAQDKVKKHVFYGKDPDAFSKSGQVRIRYHEQAIDILHSALGLCTEVGEIQETVFKLLFLGHQCDAPNIKEELGDLMWYVAIMCKALGFDLRDVMQANIDKLRARYPEGFTEHHALNRNLEKERDALEKRETG